MDKSDKSMTVVKDTRPQNDKHLHYLVTYKVPEFMRLIFKVKTFEMEETIEDNTKHINPTIISTIDRKDFTEVNLRTHTVYSVNSEGCVHVVTKVTITLPFQIPDILHPPLKLWTKTKSNSIRKRERIHAERMLKNN